MSSHAHLRPRPRRQLLIVRDIRFESLLDPVMLSLLALVIVLPLLFLTTTDIRSEKPSVLAPSIHVTTPVESQAQQPQEPQRFSAVAASALAVASHPAPPVSGPAPVEPPPKIQVIKTTPGGGGATMAAVSKALTEAVDRNWAIPAALPEEARSKPAVLDWVITREGDVKTYFLEQPSGNPQIDMSILRAAGLVKRIPMPVTPEFSGDNCEVRMQFHPR